MCENHLNINIGTYQEQRYDPTRTTTLRNAFARRMRVRFTDVVKSIEYAVVRQDVFGLNTVQANQVVRRQFDFPTNRQKIQAFIEWLQKQVDNGILTVGAIPRAGGSIEDAWTDQYIMDSYKRGVIRARVEMKKAGYDVPSIENSGGIDAVINSTPVHMDRVGILFIRAFEELKGITNQMSTQISRVLSQGMADGDNPRLIARKLNKVITGTGGDLGITDTLGRYIPAERRAEMLARTEIIRAHHKGMVQEYRTWGVEGVQVMAEFRTAGDNRVCDICSSMEGSRYTLDEAEGLIPVHPLCRCIILPIEKNPLI